MLSLQRALGVSFGAMLVRLKSLGILRPDRYEELKSIHPVELAVSRGYKVASWEYGYDGERTTARERAAWLPCRYLQLLRKAGRAGYLSDRKAAEHANLDCEEWLLLSRQAGALESAGSDQDLHRRDLEASEVLVVS